jgi:hypothetical protein
MKYDVMQGDYDASKIGEIEAENEHEAYELALEKFGHVIGDRDGWDSYLSVRVPYDVRFPNAVKEHNQRFEELKQGKEITRIFSNTKELFKALLEEILNRSRPSYYDYRTGPNFETRLPERLEYWEDVQKLLLGFRLPNLMISRNILDVKPPMVFAVHIKALKGMRSEELMLWNKKEEREKMARILDSVLYNITAPSEAVNS